MKKFLSVLLVFAMLILSVFAFSACGNDSGNGSSSSTESVESADIDPITQEILNWPIILNLIECGDIPDLDETAWNFAGSIVDEKNLTAEENEKILTENFGGSFQVVFEGGNKIAFVKGGISTEGTFVAYEQDEANKFLKATVGDEEHYIRFGASATDGSTLMIMASKKAEYDAHMFLQIEEK